MSLRLNFDAHGIWTLLTSHHAISRHVSRMTAYALYSCGVPENSRHCYSGSAKGSQWLTRSGTQHNVKRSWLMLAAPLASKAHKSGIAAYPLLATRRLRQRCRPPRPKSGRAHRQWVRLPSAAYVIAAPCAQLWARRLFGRAPLTGAVTRRIAVSSGCQHPRPARSCVACGDLS